MQTTQSLRNATPDTICFELLETIDVLANSVRRCQDALADIRRVRWLLDSLPLSSADYSNAKNRLRNAYRFLLSRETGAARFELQQLASALHAVETTEPHRRVRSRAAV